MRGVGWGVVHVWCQASVERAGFNAIHESSEKLSLLLNTEVMNERRAALDPVARAESVAKEQRFISSVESIWIEIGPDRSGPGAGAAAGAGAGKGTPNASVELARALRASPKFAKVPIFGLIAPGRTSQPLAPPHRTAPLRPAPPRSGHC